MYWENMTEDQKSEFCRNSGCTYYYGEIDDCMVDELDNPDYNLESCNILRRKDNIHES